MEIGRKVRLLLDANIVLEILFDQERAGEAKGLLAKTHAHRFFISNYAFHTIGTILFGKMLMYLTQVSPRPDPYRERDQSAPPVGAGGRTACPGDGTGVG